MLLKMMLLKRLIIIRVKSKVDGIDTSAFVTRTKFTADTNALDDKIALFYSFSHKKKSYKQSYKLVCFTRQGLVEGLPSYHQALN